MPSSPQARLDILRIHSRKMNLTRGINLRKVAEGMPGSSGAEVKGVCTEAGMYALRERRVHVTQEDFEMAVAKVRMRQHCSVGGGSTAEGFMQHSLGVRQQSSGVLYVVLF